MPWSLASVLRRCVLSLVLSSACLFAIVQDPIRTRIIFFGDFGVSFSYEYRNFFNLPQLENKYFQFFGRDLKTQCFDDDLGFCTWPPKGAEHLINDLETRETQARMKADGVEVHSRMNSQLQTGWTF